MVIVVCVLCGRSGEKATSASLDGRTIFKAVALLPRPFIRRWQTSNAQASKPWECGSVIALRAMQNGFAWKLPLCGMAFTRPAIPSSIERAAVAR